MIPGNHIVDPWAGLELFRVPNGAPDVFLDIFFEVSKFDEVASDAVYVAPLGKVGRLRGYIAKRNVIWRAIERPHSDVLSFRLEMTYRRNYFTVGLTTMPNFHPTINPSPGIFP